MTLTVEASTAAERIDSVLADLAAVGDPRVFEQAEELVRIMVEFYGVGLGRLVQLVREQPDGEQMLRQLADDKIVGGLLILHDLHPASTAERVAAALERVRPYLGSHSGDVELLGLGDDGVVRLRLAGSCNGCPSSAVTVQLAIEHAISEAAPEVLGVEVEGVVAAAPAPRIGGSDAGARPLLPLLGQTPPTPPAPPVSTWVELDGLGELAVGALTAATAGTAHTVIANLAGHLYAYRNNCPGCSSRLDDGALAADLLTCARCGQRYDLRRAGAGVDRGELHLQPLPLLAEEGTVRVAVPAGARR